jgi:hypothetical protein
MFTQKLYFDHFGPLPTAKYFMKIKMTNKSIFIAYKHKKQTTNFASFSWKNI